MKIKDAHAMAETTNVDYSTKIPNNVGLMDDQRVLRGVGAMASRIPRLVEDHGAGGFQTSDVYLRTAISIDPRGGPNSTT